MNGLLPSLAHGVPVVARKFEKFDADEAYRLMQDFKIRNIFVPPTALRMLRTIENPRAKYDLQVRTIASAGEALGAESRLALLVARGLGCPVGEGLLEQVEVVDRLFEIAAGSDHGGEVVGAPGWPELACWTASAERMRMELMARFCRVGSV